MAADAVVLPTATVTVSGGLIDSITVNTGGQYLPTGITATITGDGVGAQVTPLLSMVNSKA